MVWWSKLNILLWKVPLKVFRFSFDVCVLILRSHCLFFSFQILSSAFDSIGLIYMCICLHLFSCMVDWARGSFDKLKCKCLLLVIEANIGITVSIELREEEKQHEKYDDAQVNRYGTTIRNVTNSQSMQKVLLFTWTFFYNMLHASNVWWKFIFIGDTLSCYLPPGKWNWHKFNEAQKKQMHVSILSFVAILLFIRIIDFSINSHYSHR